MLAQGEFGYLENETVGTGCNRGFRRGSSRESLAMVTRVQVEQLPHINPSPPFLTSISYKTASRLGCVLGLKFWVSLGGLLLDVDLLYVFLHRLVCLEAILMFAVSIGDAPQR